MNRTTITLLVTLAVAGCRSSEEAGTSGAQQGSPQPISTATADTIAAVERSAELTSVQDTLRASVVTHTKRERLPVRPIIHPKNPVYTVQLGAFADPQNALSFHKDAMERFGDLPVFNHYEAVDGLYRVSVGRFATLAEATKLRNTILKLYPKEYPECWVNYISP
jgi:cell division septation protein DedD